MLAGPRTVASPGATFPLTVGAAESKVEEPPAQRIARSLVALSKRLRLSDAEIAQLAKLAGHIVELDLTCSIEIDDAGWSTVTYSHQLLNLTNRPIKRLTRFRLRHEALLSRMEVRDRPSPRRRSGGVKLEAA